MTILLIILGLPRSIVLLMGTLIVPTNRDDGIHLPSPVDSDGTVNSPVH